MHKDILAKKFFQLKLIEKFAVLLSLLVVFIYLGRVSGLQDSGTLMAAVQDMVNKKNPYLDPFFLNGFAIAFPYSFLKYVLGSLLFVRLYVLLNICLLVYVFFELSKKAFSLRNRLFLCLILLISSPMRAMVDSVQHTGLLIACIYFSFKIFLNLEGADQFVSLKKNLLASFLVFIVFELKPHFCLFIILILVTKRKLRIVLLYFFVIFTVTHIGISISLKMPLDLYWIERLMGRSGETTMANSRENSLWTLFGTVLGYPVFWLVSSVLLFVVLIIFTLVRFRHKPFTMEYLIPVLIAPLSLAYVHTYDLLAVIFLLATSAQFAKSPKFSDGLWLLLLLPTLSRDLVLIGGSVLLFVLVSIVRHQRISSGSWFFYSLIITYYLLVDFYVSDVGLRVNILLSVITIYSFALFGKQFIQLSERF